MKPIQFKSLLSAALLALVAAGCSSPSYQKAENASSSLEDAAKVIHKGNGQIDAVLFAMSSLVNSPAADLKPQFEKFDSAVNTLESLSKEVNKESVAMQTQGADYFRNWDLELAKIQNEDIRARSTERKNTVAARFEKLRAGYVQTRTDFAPLMSDLKDIRTALATDLTTGGLASIKGSANEAQDNVAPLRVSLSRLEEDFKALGVSLSSTSTTR
jgi:hypothetical protein